MITQSKLVDFAKNSIYATPHKLSTAVFLAVHTSLATSQAIIGNNYLESKIDQFREHPIATTFEIMAPYIVTYVSNSIGRRLK